jgi:hypothetical protein
LAFILWLAAPALAQQADTDVVAVTVREHGEECSDPSKLERDEEHSKPDQEAWLITCEEATYRVIYEGSGTPKVQKVE